MSTRHVCPQLDVTIWWRLHLTLAAAIVISQDFCFGTDPQDQTNPIKDREYVRAKADIGEGACANENTEAGCSSAVRSDGTPCEWNARGDQCRSVYSKCKGAVVAAGSSQTYYYEARYNSAFQSFKNKFMPSGQVTKRARGKK